MTLQTLLQTRREAIGLSRLELARLTGLPPSSVAYLERTPGVRAVQPGVLAKLAAALGVPVADVYRAAGYEATDSPQVGAAA